MDRIEKIGTCLVVAALIAVLVSSHRSRGHNGNLTGLRMNASAVPDDCRRGPSYLLSALPEHRRSDDFTDAVSDSWT